MGRRWIALRLLIIGERATSFPPLLRPIAGGNQEAGEKILKWGEMPRLRWSPSVAGGGARFPAGKDPLQG